MLYAYDLAVPRDLEPVAGLIPGLLVQDLESLKSLFAKHNKKLTYHVRAIEDLIGKAIGIIKERVDVYPYNKSWSAAKPAFISAG
jgi:glutamyl-tRNA reductase